jgi:anthranilate synthase component 2
MLGQEVLVFAHDKITIEQIRQLDPQYLVISPGPKAPEDAGISLEAIKKFHQTIPILGICLGHQCLAKAFGGTIIQAPEIVHGYTSQIVHHYQKLFKNIPNNFNATRYHSLAVDCETLPTCFSIDAFTDETIMAISHRQHPLFGLQFHPEAILSQYGLEILKNFLTYEPCKTF